MEVIQNLFNHGALVVPGQGKKPLYPYQLWRDTPPDMLEYLDMWDRHVTDEVHLLCGTGGFYAFDIDAKNCTVTDYMPWIETNNDILHRLYMEETPSGGIHFIFRYEGPIQSAMLAQADDRKPFIELVGTPKLCRIWPTPGIVRQNVYDITKTPVLTDAELIKLIDSATKLTKFIPPPVVKYERVERPKNDGVSPGDDYSDNVHIEDVISLFEKHGWSPRRTIDRVYLRRPGARTKNYDADIHLHMRLFRNYSGSDATFQIDRGYRFFGCYAMLEHGGDMSAAAKALYADGWGDRRMVTPEVRRSQTIFLHGDVGVQEDTDGFDPLLAELYGSEIHPEDKYEDIFTVVFESRKTRWDRRSYGIGVGGSVGIVSGPAGSRKTAVTSALAASATSGLQVLGFNVYVPEGGHILIFDTEQPKTFVWRTLNKILKQAKLTNKPETLKVFSMRAMKDPEKRMKAIEACISDYMARGLKIGAVIIDGIKDLAVDFLGDNKEATRIIEFMMWVASGDDRTATCIGVIHTNPGSDKVRGHLGTEAINKADWAVMVTADENADNLSTIAFTKTRGTARPPAVDFLVDDQNTPYMGGELWQDDKRAEVSTSGRSDEDIPF